MRKVPTVILDVVTIASYRLASCILNRINTFTTSWKLSVVGWIKCDNQIDL
jgi:hypothetical protein